MGEIDSGLYSWISIGVIAWGVLDCFFGYRVFKITLALFGAVLGMGLFQLAAQQLGASQTTETVALIMGAILGAGLAFLLYIAAVFLAGFGFGTTLGMLLLANYHHMIAVLTGLVLGVIGGFLAIKLQRVLIVLSTALIGAFRAVLASAYFTSQLDWLFYFRHPDQLPAVIESNGWMLPAVLALAVIGVITQLEIGGSTKKSKDKSD